VTTVLVILGVMIAMTGGMWAAQRRLIYFPDRRTPGIEWMGSRWGDVAYETSDGLTLHGWFSPPPGEAPVVIVFNGNGGNRGDRGPLGEALVNRGFGVLLTDYRGYGGNPGDPSEEGLAGDAEAAARFVSDTAPGHPVAYFGESLGSAVAIRLTLDRPPAALVLRSPFTSMVDVGRTHYPWVPVGVLLKDRYPSIERIGAVAVPLLVIAGDADGIVPVDQSRAIFEAAQGPKDFLVIPGADHNDPELVHGPDVIDATVRFLEAATSAG
jgi:fermentation-respiration switch protein FrsA (DUF1100 family)